MRIDMKELFKKLGEARATVKPDRRLDVARLRKSVAMASNRKK